MTIGKFGRVRPTRAVHAREFDGEMVLLNLEKGEYFGLDELGARLWRGLEMGKSVSEIALQIAPDHDVEPDRLLTDLVALTDELVRRGLAEPVS